jgi:hypothetical protein
MDVMLAQLDESSVIEWMRQQKTLTAPSAPSTIASEGYKRARSLLIKAFSFAELLACVCDLIRRDNQLLNPSKM